MGAQLLPLFPLSVVLVPGMSLPLHIFEERYKEMMGDLIPAEGEFGVVLAKDDGIVNIGCTATVANVVREYPDGRLDLVATGQRRFQIESLDEEKSYLRGAVEYFDDEDVTSASAELCRKAGAAYRQLIHIEKPEAPSADSKLEPGARLSFRIAQFISDLDKRQTVLSLRSEVERLEYLVKIVPEYIIQRKQMALAKRVGPQNGHAKHVTSS
jgi:Lon protease-like protein